jgi:hypothetical protein
MKKHFLLVDRDSERLKIMTSRLHEHFSNCKCTWATDADHAAKILAYLQPDTVLCHKEEEQHPLLKKIIGIRSIPLLLYDGDTMPYEIFGKVFVFN